MKIYNKDSTNTSGNFYLKLGKSIQAGKAHPHYWREAKLANVEAAIFLASLYLQCPSK
jgi:hypothetical protein